jgi:hypothetical protein
MSSADDALSFPGCRHRPDRNRAGRSARRSARLQRGGNLATLRIDIPRAADSADIRRGRTSERNVRSQTSDANHGRDVQLYAFRPALRARPPARRRIAPWPSTPNAPDSIVRCGCAGACRPGYAAGRMVSNSNRPAGSVRTQPRSPHGRPSASRYTPVASVWQANTAGGEVPTRPPRTESAVTRRGARRSATRGRRAAPATSWRRAR